MAKSPYYTVTVGDVNITELISSLDYEDLLKGDDMVVFKVKGLLIRNGDDEIFNTGKEWVFNFGFIDGLKSTKRRCVITETEFNYSAGRINLTVTARDLGYLLKRVSGTTVYKEKTASEIAEDIADKFGLEKDIEKTSTLYDYTAMGNKNFMQFLKDVAEKEGVKKDAKKGGVEVYVRGNKLTFKQRDLAIEATKMYIYGDGNSTIKSVDVQYNDTGSSGTNEVQTSGIDTETGEAYTTKVTNEDNKEATTGPEDVVFDVGGVLKENNGTNFFTTFDNQFVQGKTENVPAENKEEAEKKISKNQKDSKVQAMTLTLTVELDPTINAGDIITLAGVSVKHIGNWRITKVNHIINNGGGKTVMECNRNGAKKTSSVGDKKTQGDVNDSKGNEDGSIEKELPIFDVNGNKL